MFEVLAILVLYKKNLFNSESYSSILHSAKRSRIQLRFYVFDNSPQKNHVLSDFDNQPNPIEYRHSASNLGISYAYNEGAKFAERENIDWLLLLDQDTIFGDDFLFELESCIDKNPKVYLFAPILKLSDNHIFSPTKYRLKRGYELTKVEPGINSLKKLLPVNSGMVIKTEKFVEVGGYNTKLKLDFCDFQFLEKFREKHFEFCLVNSTGFQNFSNKIPDVSEQQVRFNIYLNDAKNCEKVNFSARLQYFYTVLHHTLGLTWKFKKSYFICRFITGYLLFNKVKQESKIK
jgi:GT2 family glycosyltransferase